MRIQSGQFMNHKHAATKKGVTENYIGGSSREYYNDRAANANRVQGRREPKLTVYEDSLREAVDRRVTLEEI